MMAKLESPILQLKQKTESLDVTEVIPLLFISYELHQFSLDILKFMFRYLIIAGFLENYKQWSTISRALKIQIFEFP